MQIRAGHCIFVACLMKLMCKLVELEFSTLDPAHFHRKNHTSNGPAVSNSKETCYFDASLAGAPTAMHLATSWLYTGRYLLPVLGGLVSSAWLGCVRVLQLGGNAMLLSTVLFAFSVKFDLMCQDSPVIIITWLLLPVFYGLNQPNILLAIFRWHRKDKLCTVMTTTYYAFAILGEMISMPFVYRYFASEHIIGRNFTLVFIVVSIAFLTLTAFMPEIREEEPFQLPTTRRMIKYFQIFSALILFLAFEGDERPAVYKSELNYLLNGTLSIVEQRWLSPEFIKCTSFLVLSLPLMLAAVISRRRLAAPSRMLPGILLKCAIELCLIIVTSFDSASVTVVLAIYSTMSVLDGAAELLVMVAAYDLGCLLLPDSSQCLILGVMYTVRGVSNFVSRGLFRLLVDVNKSRKGSKPLFFVYHLIALVMLIGCFCHHKFVTLPTASHMTALSEEDEIDAAEHDQIVDDADSDVETRPLLDRP